MSNDELKSAFKQIAEDRAYTLRDYFTRTRLNPTGKKQVTARSANQRRYIEAIDKNDIVFGIGVAGTGKTYLAVAMAVQALMQKRVNRIVLARPAVEAGEKLGFLPGDLQDKVDPYLRPLYDALFDLVDYEKVTRLLEKRVIEVAPLAFMRGRTLADAFIILDEAQNTTSEQMKMFLTRIGFGSKAVITGDFVVTAPEVNPLLRALRENDIAVTAVHSHMLDETPRLFFVHFWANDDATKLANALRVALNTTGVARS